ncbi:uncharacterized protein LOC132046672 [Lycium ferocissimum]|uniref:uncharacterized protein LOC132046672 n=1 Tax=Lycium ferocissimum TaxID=112874 RepID=UPI0028158D58|nr:uncharacterized protein LOC132046672 [Lycium ferocissimum]
MNFSCGEKEAPALAPDKRSNSSIFEPCHWADCGGGSCNKTSSVTYSCDCQEGYYNLLNQTAFPCLKKCALGMDCAQLGIDVPNNNSSAPPSLPGIENVCKEMNCGKGTCKSSNSTFGFACECEPGWRQTRSENDNFFKFLPCVVPNCTMNFSCGEKEAPAPAPDKRSNSSIFEPCYWANCGGGSCNKTSPMTYSCDCQEGYYNLLNQTAFPCFKKCALGMDCAQLGIDVMNNNSSPPPSLPDNSKSIAISFFGGGYGWLIITVASMAAVLLI